MSQEEELDTQREYDQGIIARLRRFQEKHPSSHVNIKVGVDEQGKPVFDITAPTKILLRVWERHHSRMIPPNLSK